MTKKYDRANRYLLMIIYTVAALLTGFYRGSGSEQHGDFVPKAFICLSVVFVFYILFVNQNMTAYRKALCYGGLLLVFSLFYCFRVNPESFSILALLVSVTVALFGSSKALERVANWIIAVKLVQLFFHDGKFGFLPY